MHHIRLTGWIAAKLGDYTDRCYWCSKKDRERVATVLRKTVSFHVHGVFTDRFHSLVKYCQVFGARSLHRPIGQRCGSADSGSAFSIQDDFGFAVVNRPPQDVERGVHWQWLR